MVISVIFIALEHLILLIFTVETPHGCLQMVEIPAKRQQWEPRAAESCMSLDPKDWTTLALSASFGMTCMTRNSSMPCVAGSFNSEALRAGP